MRVVPSLPPGLVPSLTGVLVPPRTRSSCHREPEVRPSHWQGWRFWPPNRANIESFGFYLTASASADASASGGPGPGAMAATTTLPGDASGGDHPAGGLTTVELTWIEGRVERWIRFGRHTSERILDRRRRVLGFAPGAAFAFICWAANDFGTIASRIDIVLPVTPGRAYTTLPFVRPGGDVLLSLRGWPRVERVLRAIDLVEAADLDPCDAAPDHWRHVHNRIAAGLDPRPYSPVRHRAWLLRREIQS